MSSHFIAYKCRPASIQDLPDIIAIYNQSVYKGTVTADMHPVSLTERIPWFLQHNDPTRPLFVFEDPTDSRIAAWLSFQDFYGRKAYNITKEISIYIDQAHVNAGLGKYILDYAIAYAAQAGIENLLGFIFEENEISCHLFAKKGFKIWGRLPEVAQTDSGYRTLMLMGLRVK